VAHETFGIFQVPGSLVAHETSGISAHIHVRHTEPGTEQERFFYYFFILLFYDFAKITAPNKNL
jgi:hypothetical protein